MSTPPTPRPTIPPADLYELAAIVALVRNADQPGHLFSGRIEEDGSAMPLLEEYHGLMAETVVEAELPTVELWAEQGELPTTLLDEAYPTNLHAVHDRPPLVFIAGELTAADTRSVAIIGSRDASPAGLRASANLAEHLVGRGYAVVSGLARGIDQAAHRRALALGGRTVAVIGTGLHHNYPPEHADLQREIAARGALVSQFWPESPPTARSFPLRNAVMSGMALATVIIEAAHTSGARIQARRALAHGRPVLLRDTLLTQPWAQELAALPGVHIVTRPSEVTAVLERLTATGSLTD